MNQTLCNSNRAFDTLRRLGRALIAGIALLAFTVTAQADPFGFHVTLDTSGLSALMLSPYSIEYYLSDNGTLNNNSVNISNILFGTGGTATGSPSYIGGASGSLSIGVNLADTTFNNDFKQTFTPGSQLSFDVSLPDVQVDAIGPDHFGFAIVDTNGDFVGSNELVGVDLNNSQLTLGDVTTGSYLADDQIYTAQISPLDSPSAVPEPVFYQMSALLGCGAIAMGVSRRKAAPPQIAA